MSGSHPRWKKWERYVARAHGVEREPSDGLKHGDALPDLLSIETKTRESLPKWFTEAVEQARAAANGRVPVVVLVEVRQGVKARKFVVLDWAAWDDLYGVQAIEARS